MTKEVMKQAIQVLKKLVVGSKYEDVVQAVETIKALEEALKQEHDEPDDLTIAYMAGSYDGKKQAKQEHGQPVAWISQNAGLYHFKPDESIDSMPLYLTPQTKEWVGLADDDDIDWKGGGTLRDLVKAIEAKLKEKNT